MAEETKAVDKVEEDAVVEEKVVEKKKAPAKKNSTQPSLRTLKGKIKEYEIALGLAAEEVQSANERARIFQDQAQGLKQDIAALKQQQAETMATVRGALITAVNIIDVMGGK